MCGIVGVYNFKSTAPISNQNLGEMRDSLKHRGPDGSEIFINNCIGLAHTRLSIIGLTSGSQPMTSSCGNYVITYNGEIYNYKDLKKKLSSKGYKFKTDSDTEVILALYSLGYKSPESYLRGMFAFAIFNLKTKTLVLSRDRIGLKPLFYEICNQGITFASEIKAILVARKKRSLDYQAISDFLTMGYVSGGISPFKGIKMLGPGEKLEIKKGSTPKLAKYWTPQNNLNLLQLDENAITEKISKSFSNAVESRMISDVPIGIFLSGGIDSNAVLAKMRAADLTSNFKSYTARFESPSYDESNIAKRMSDHFGIVNKQTTISANDFKKYFGTIVHHSDRLHANPAMLANFILSRQASQDLKVILSGGGGDELYMGYPTYVADSLNNFVGRLPKKLLNIFFRASHLLPTSHKKLSTKYKLQKFLNGASPDPYYAHYFWRTIFTEEDKSNLLNPDIKTEDSFWTYKQSYDQSMSKDFFDQVSFADLFVWFSDMCLYQSDSMSMANGLEMRVPMTDIQFIELSWQIPTILKMRKQRGKYILKKALKTELPNWLLDIKKSGFHIPLAEWFSGELRGFVRDNLSQSRLNTVGFLNQKYVSKVIEDHENKRYDNSFKIFNLLVLTEWFHHFL